MEMYERIKNLRKNHLKLSQEAFGERLGVTRSVINNIERNALARPDQKLSLIKLICKEFSINEDWLLNGNEPMRTTPDTFSLDAFMAEHGATDLELQIVKTYFELDPDTRQKLFDHFKSRFAASSGAEPEEPHVSAPAKPQSDSNVVPMSVREDTPDYLTPQAAHNDAETTDAELEKMQRDIKLMNQMRDRKK